MNIGGGAVQRQRDHLYVGLFHLLADLVVNQRTVGCHAHSQAQRCSVFGQLEDIGSQERFAAREHDNRFGEVGYVLEKLLAFLGGEVAFG